MKSNPLQPAFGYYKHRFSPITGKLGYYLAEVPLISTEIMEVDSPFLRRGSDGNLQSKPLSQQLFLALDHGRDAEITFFLSKQSVNMKPQRAQNGDAILGQIGAPLLYGVNGLYDIYNDVLISWNGANWRWLDDHLHDALYDPIKDRVVMLNSRNPEEQRGCVAGKAARISVELTAKPWSIQIYPRYYRDHLGYTYHAPWTHRPNISPITGWCSWEAFHRDVDADNLKSAIHFLKKELAPYGLQYIQVDDGYQSEPIPPTSDGNIGDSWLTPNDRFPHGHDDIEGIITASGFDAGIWTSARITNSDFAKNNDNSIADSDTNTLEGDWIKYVPSCTEEFLSDQLIPLYKGLKEKGYTYIKADTLRHLLFEGLMTAAEKGILTNEQVEKKYRRYMESIREGIGKDIFLLSCWGVISQMIGVCDACRIASDANPTWGSFRMQIYESARWFHTQRILFQNDPDHICARSHIEWTRSLLSLVSMTGGLFMLSDDVSEYDETRLNLIRKTIPAQPVMTAETGPVSLSKPAFAYGPGARKTGDDLTIQDALHVSAAEMVDLEQPGFGNLWATHYLVHGRRWCVVGRFALVPQEKTELHISALGLNPQKHYHAFDFWEERYLGIVQGTLNCPSLKLGDCQIVSLVPESDRPMYIADNRHISMGYSFLGAESWNGNALTLRLTGVEGKNFTCWISIPDEHEISGTETNGAIATWVQDDVGENVRRLDLAFQAATAEIEISF